METPVEVRRECGSADGGANGAAGQSCEALVALLRSEHEWIANRPIYQALNMVSTRGNHALVNHWRDGAEFLEKESCFLQNPFGGGSGQKMRFYSKRGVIKVGLRARTDPAKAFQARAALILERALTHPDFADLWEGRDNG